LPVNITPISILGIKRRRLVLRSLMKLMRFSPIQKNARNTTSLVNTGSRQVKVGHLRPEQEAVPLDLISSSMVTLMISSMIC
jgi:hypothetical protein